MHTEIRHAVSDLSEAAADTKKMYKKAARLSPRMKKQITVSSQYYTKLSGRSPCAQALFKLDIDCNLLKLMLIVLILMCMLCVIFRTKLKR